jgi:class 3 adenylate cyclase
MTPYRASSRYGFGRSIVCKNIVLFVAILLVAVVPLAWRYYRDCREDALQRLATTLEVFAERGASWVDVAALPALTQPEQQQTPAYQALVQTLQRMERAFNIETAAIVRRAADGRYPYVATGDDRVAMGQPVARHTRFPATYTATNATWIQGAMRHSHLFGGGQFGQFMQIDMPLKHQGTVVALLTLTASAQPVAAAAHAKALTVVGLTSGLLVVGLTLFGVISARMLRPLQDLTAAADRVAQGELTVTVPPPSTRDEVGQLTRAFHTMLAGLRQREVMRDTFGRYLSKEVVAELLGSPEGLKLGGEVREVTFLVSDLRGFSSLAAHLPPQAVIDILNRYLERMVDIIMRYQGTIDEFQGDGILAFFGAPLAADDDPERAVACALAMQAAMAEINAEQRRRQLPELAMGIGMNTGEVVVGNIGSEKRAKYGAVGSAINVASHIESLTVGGQILLSQSLYERVRPLVRVRGTRQVQLKGLDHPVMVYDITGLQGPSRRTLPTTTPEVLTPLVPPLPITCFPLDGKVVTDTAIAGALTHLAVSTAKAALERPIAIHTNLKLLLASRHAAGPSAVYAKVLALESPEAASAPTTVYLGFTVIAEDTTTFLARTRTGGLQKEAVRLRHQSAVRGIGSNGTAPRTVTEGKTA